MPSATWTAVTTLPTLTASGWKQEHGAAARADDGRLRPAWVAIAHGHVIPETDSWAVLKGLALWPGQREAERWLVIGKPLWDQDYVERHWGLSARP